MCQGKLELSAEYGSLAYHFAYYCLINNFNADL